MTALSPSTRAFRASRWLPIGRPHGLVIGLLCLASIRSLLGGQDGPSWPQRVTEPVPLFNGRDLSGWRTWLVDTRDDDPRRVFTVEDGTIRISGEGFGYLSTLTSYRDYHLIVEYRWGSRNWGPRVGKARDSGVFLHAVGPDGNSYDGNGAYRAAIECQVMQGAVGDLILIRGRSADGSNIPVRLSARVAPQRDREGWPTWQPDGMPITLMGTGRVNWLAKDAEWKDQWNFRGRQDCESPVDQWTRIECFCRNDTIEVRVNGQLVNRADHVFPSAGEILLQCEGSEIFFRRIELLPLEK